MADPSRRAAATPGFCQRRLRVVERQAVAQYQKTVQVAFGEVREALAAQSRTREVFAAESERVTALSETLRLAGIRFDTSGAKVTGSRWQNELRTNVGFVARHPAGL